MLGIDSFPDVHFLSLEAYMGETWLEKVATKIKRLLGRMKWPFRWGR